MTNRIYRRENSQMELNIFHSLQPHQRGFINDLFQAGDFIYSTRLHCDLDQVYKDVLDFFDYRYSTGDIDHETYEKRGSIILKGMTKLVHRRKPILERLSSDLQQQIQQTLKNDTDALRTIVNDFLNEIVSRLLFIKKTQ